MAACSTVRGWTAFTVRLQECVFATSLCQRAGRYPPPWYLFGGAEIGRQVWVAARLRTGCRRVPAAEEAASKRQGRVARMRPGIALQREASRAHAFAAAWPPSDTGSYVRHGGGGRDQLPGSRVRPPTSQARPWPASWSDRGGLAWAPDQVYPSGQGRRVERVRLPWPALAFRACSSSTAITRGAVTPDDR